MDTQTCKRVYANTHARALQCICTWTPPPSHTQKGLETLHSDRVESRRRREIHKKKDLKTKQRRKKDKERSYMKAKTKKLRRVGEALAFRSYGQLISQLRQLTLPCHLIHPPPLPPSLPHPPFQFRSLVFCSVSCFPPSFPLPPQEVLRFYGERFLSLFGK